MPWLLISLALVALVAGAMYTRAPLTGRTLLIMGAGLVLIVLVVLNPVPLIHLYQAVMRALFLLAPHL
jgi:hypothetical protein